MLLLWRHKNLKAELEKHLKPTKLRKNVHGVKCDDGSCDITAEIMNVHYAEKNEYYFVVFTGIFSGLLYCN